MYVCMHACLCVHVHECACMCMHVHACICMPMHVYEYMHMLHMYICIYTHMYMFMYMYMYMYMHMYMYVSTHMAIPHSCDETLNHSMQYQNTATWKLATGMHVLLLRLRVQPAGIYRAPGASSGIRVSGFGFGFRVSGLGFNGSK